MISAEKIHQPNIILGSIVRKDYHNNITGGIFNYVYTYINRVFKNSFAPDYCSVAQGLILGGSSRLSAELKNIFARAGVLHILAVSGLHVGFIIAFLGTVFLFLPVPYKLKFVLIMLFLVFYAGITGFRPSVLRASLMTSLFGLAFILQRQVNPIHIVNMSALTILSVSPLTLFDTGAQLSFGAVYGIVYLLPKINAGFLKKIESRIFKSILWSMATSLSAQIFVSPFLIQYFSQLPTLAVFSNILVVPLASIIIYLLFILIIVSLIFRPLVGAIVYLTVKLIWVLENVAKFFASLPFACLGIDFSPVFLVLFYFIFVKKVRKYAIFAMCIMAIIFSLMSLFPVSLIQMTNNGALITLVDREKILLCEGGIRILPPIFYDKDVDYLIAQKRIIEAKKEFVLLPENLYYKNLKIGDFLIHLGKRINIQVEGNEFSVPEQGLENRIRHIILGKSRMYQFETPAELSVLDQMGIDFHKIFGKLMVSF